MSSLTSWLSLIKPGGADLAGSPTGPTQLNTDLDMIDDHIAGMERYAEMHITADQSIANNTTTTPNWTAQADAAPGSLVDLANDRFVIPDAGIWMFLLQVGWDIGSTGVRSLFITSSGAGTGFVTATQLPVPTFQWGQQVVGIRNCILNEQITAKVFHTQGAALNMLGGAVATRSSFIAQQLKSL